MVDFQENSHGDLLLEFMTTVNCIMLNGRNDSEEINGFTYYGPHGQSVVDYVMISHDRLDMFSSDYCTQTGVPGSRFGRSV